MAQKMRWLVVSSLAALTLVFGFAFVACGGDGSSSTVQDAQDDTALHVEGDESEDGQRTHEEGDGQEDGAEQVVLHATLSEWSITGHEGSAEFAAAPGEVTIEAHNEGATLHELVLMRTDLPPAELPVTAGAVDEEAAGELLGRTPQFSNGQMELLTFDLEPGSYVLFCNIPGHYQQGMRAQLVVE